MLMVTVLVLLTEESVKLLKENALVSIYMKDFA